MPLHGGFSVLPHFRQLVPYPTPSDILSCVDIFNVCHWTDLTHNRVVGQCILDGFEGFGQFLSKIYHNSLSQIQGGLSRPVSVDTDFKTSHIIRVNLQLVTKT